MTTRHIAGADPRICEGGGALRLFSVRPSLPFPVPSLFPSLSPPSPFNQLGDLGKRCKLPQRVGGGAPAENEFGAL